MGPILRGGDGEQIWKSVLKRTQNYCVDLLALYLRQMIIKIHYSNKVVNLHGSCGNNALPRPHRKSFSSLQYSVPACEKSSLLIQERNMLFVDLTVKLKHIHLDSYKDFKSNIRQKKTETKFALRVLRNSYITMFETQEIDLVTFYKY